MNQALYAHINNKTKIKKKKKELHPFVEALKLNKKEKNSSIKKWAEFKYDIFDILKEDL
jgi:hypothetical protein